MPKVNSEIAVTHVITRKKQTLVAALGVTIGVAIYLFMNSLSSGFTSFSRGETFKNNAHLKIYKSDEISQSLLKETKTNGTIPVIINPQITTTSQTLINPATLLQRVNNEPYITDAIAQIDFNIFYNRGKTQVKGNGVGVNMVEYAKMFRTGEYMVAGDLKNLQGNLNGIIIGSGIAEKLNLGVDDNITVSSSFGVSKVLKIVGIFTMGNRAVDEGKSFVNVSTAQQLLTEGPSYVTTIYANTPDPDKSEIYAAALQNVTPYTVEDWKTTNADILASDKTRNTMMGAISLSILFVSAFGIYNILSATIAQKINDIAILKAVGFVGKDVIRIFVYEAVIMGVIGTFIGLVFGAILINIMARVYVGGVIGYFPITMEFPLFMQSLFLGLLITICAGYFPARKAAQIDPVEIFRV